jgi:RNA polymerase sigma factor (sigma-70 family)
MSETTVPTPRLRRRRSHRLHSGRYAAMSPRPQGGWTLTPQAFERLLGRLAAEPEAGAREYDAIRRKLVLFFTMRGTTDAEELADEALDRLARRLDEGEPVDNVRAYVVGVAKRVIMEDARRRGRERAYVDGHHAIAAPADTDDERAERRSECLERCLGELPADSRALIVDYYRGDGAAYLKERKALAERLGVSYVALKTRAHRVRNRLEECLRECAEGARAVTDAPSAPRESR